MQSSDDVRRKVLDEVEREFHLPSWNTNEPERDPGYVCVGCKEPTKEKE
jgi:hypothetical protein